MPPLPAESSGRLGGPPETASDVGKRDAKPVKSKGPAALAAVV